MTNLTTLVTEDEFKEILKKIEKPDLKPDSIVTTCPDSYSQNDYPLIGTAFDYLLRFELQRKYRNTSVTVHSGSIVAESAVSILSASNGYDSTYISNVVADSKQEVQDYVNCNTDIVPFQAVIDLSRIDSISRVGPKVLPSVADNIGTYKDEYVTDLENLLQSCNSILEATDFVTLNPVLGSYLLQADCDLIIDDMLIDIKTTKNPSFATEYWRQLVGYLVLLDINSRNNNTVYEWDVSKPSQAGILFSRSSDLCRFDTEYIYNHDEYDTLYTYVNNQYM